MENTVSDLRGDLKSSAQQQDVDVTVVGGDQFMSYKKRYVTVAILFLVNLLNYMDRYTVAGKFHLNPWHYQRILPCVFTFGSLYKAYSPTSSNFTELEMVIQGCYRPSLLLASWLPVLCSGIAVIVITGSG